MESRTLRHNPSGEQTEVAARPIWKRLGPRELVEIFAVFNLSFLALDILLAHSYNRFRHWAEWIPFVFSCAVPVIMAPAMWVSRLDPRRGASKWAGLVVGWVSVIVGVTGMVLHLNSNFFEAMTIKSLVYTAPFIAPLSYAGVGMLLILNRSVISGMAEWSGWVLLLAAGGFFGNFVLSLTDHAQIGFYGGVEWIAVGAGALGFAFLLMPVVMNVTSGFVRICFVVMALQVIVGLVGFGLHVRADLRGKETTIWDLVHGAPPFAPLLFANIALLGAIGLWARGRAVRSTAV